MIKFLFRRNIMKGKALGFGLIMMIVVIGCKKDANINTPKVTQGEWKIVRNADTLNRFSGIYFSDQMNGWAVGNSGIILHTSDGGNSWNVQESGTKIPLHCVHFVNSQKGWVGGISDSIGITTNGGVTWNWHALTGEQNKISHMSMSFVNEHTGWIAGGNGGILHTEDGGITWTPQVTGTIYTITGIQFLDAKEGWAVATNRIILHTTNGGNTWVTKFLDDPYNGYTVVLEDIFFINHSKGWIATNSAISSLADAIAPIVCTADTGRSWNLYSSKAGWMQSIQFVDESSGWAAGDGGILYTTDSGITWDYQLKVPSGMFVDLCFVDQSHGWAITYTGDIYRYQLK
jgi:photosystem II stability/assembly factor-like uncharacterized protein